MAEARKHEHWGDDRRYWTRAGRSRMNQDYYWLENHVGTLAMSLGLVRWEQERALKSEPDRYVGENGHDV